MNIRIGYEHPDSLITYPDAPILSRYSHALIHRAISSVGCIHRPSSSAFLDTDDDTKLRL